MAGRLSPSRTPQPQLLSPTRDEVHEVYTSAHDDYVNNRVSCCRVRASLSRGSAKSRAPPRRHSTDGPFVMLCPAVQVKGLVSRTSLYYKPSA